MNKRKGFTLVELLVVMAIISILAAILVPNVVRYIARGRATRALGDIKAIELALTKMVTDGNVQNLNYFFNPDAVRGYLGIQQGAYMTSDQFLRAVELYTRVMYALLREGRRVLDGRADSKLGIQYSQVLDGDVVMRLGVGYLEDLGFDPWGNLYNIYPGPWNPRNGPCPFRIYLLGQKELDLPGMKGGGRIDYLTLRGVTDPETGMAFDPGIGFPADGGKFVFIWSNGANMVSGQAIYNPQLARQALDNPTFTIPDPQVWYADQEDDYKGGGDDINNWDQGQSWMRFYS